MASHLDRTLLALADPTRRSVVDLLRCEPRQAGELAELLEVSRPAMSRHLRVLRQCGLVSETSVEEDARGRLYRLERERFDELRDWIDDVQAFWTDQLQAFKTHAERRAKGKKP